MLIGFKSGSVILSLRPGNKMGNHTPLQICFQVFKIHMRNVHGDTPDFLSKDWLLESSGARWSECSPTFANKELGLR